MTWEHKIISSGRMPNYEINRQSKVKLAILEFRFARALAKIKMRRRIGRVK